MIKRFFLFALTNILIIVTLSIVLSVLGVRPYLTSQGINYGSLMAFCLVWGSGGAFISLLLSRWMAKTMMGIEVLEPQSTGRYGFLVNMVHDIARRANLPKMPEVGIYDSPQPNAFATGPSKSRSLVAVSTGLIESMGRNELEGVIAHEIAHIKNGDMVTMTLLQGIINAFVMFFARIVAFAMTQNSRDEENRGGGSWANFLLVPLLEIFFSFFGMMVVMWFSRKREFRADAGSAQLVGTTKMIAALESLKRTFELPQVQEVEEPRAVAALKINDKPSWFALLASHPPIDDRINALKRLGGSVR